MESPYLINKVPNEDPESSSTNRQNRSHVSHIGSRNARSTMQDLDIQIVQDFQNPTDNFGASQEPFDNTPNANDNNNFNNATIPSKLNNMNINNSWNDKNERLVVSIGENAAAYKWMHEKNATRLKSFHKFMNIAMVVFNTGLSAQTIIPQGETRNEAITIVSQVFIYIVTLISVLANFLKYEELAAKHSNFAMKFSELYHEIQQQMCMYRKDRHQATQYIQDTLKRFDEIVVSAPTIDNAIITQFKSTFKDSKTAVPSIVDRLDNIEIITDNVPPPEMTFVGSTSKSGLMKSKTSNLKALSKLTTTKQQSSLHIGGDITDNEIENIQLSELN